jgi:hypothetical protein
MSGGSFRSVFMVASCAAAALGCYMVSLRVASERAALEQVETEIVLAKRDIRVLQTEIGTRGRLAQLERWNVKVLSLSAPSVDQFLGGGFELARLVQPKRKIDIEAPVVLAAAPGDAPKPQVQRTPSVDEPRDLSPKALLQTVSLKRELPASPVAKPKQDPARAAAPEKKPLVKADPAKPATEKAKAPADKPKSSLAKPKAATSEKKIARADPLAPLKANAAKPKKPSASSTAKEPSKTP